MLRAFSDVEWICGGGMAKLADAFGLKIQWTERSRVGSIPTPATNRVCSSSIVDLRCRPVYLMKMGRLVLLKRVWGNKRLSSQATVKFRRRLPGEGLASN